ncbi:MAG: tetratricopeptide repeat protein [Ignavibacteria bacterium]|nr:tetratricopeptide repeat protein [Ignavibacteria bacterium]MBT8383894.1 tetratricopeptide repeat protein [Ignavibacteria bacterium]MBT8390639.1 tetratricopeptide repeat protein [Ignavibacteria bacterium]NNJ51706.1 tetratricopeptide repeat protein [Ignavibacteriaceae bacterium]NNL22272.1 tetratricopeptide repeat protein [Ignavibacteriaceae bacterium]
MISIWKKTGLAATVVIALIIPLSFFVHKPPSQTKYEKAEFVGGEECISCHQREYNLWKGSDHDNAMDIANDSTVLGDFNNVQVEFRGKQHKFYKRDGKYFVYTEGPKGEMNEFQLTHTFGVRPLQQYLVPFENGKYQCLPIAWDTEKKEWYHLFDKVYADENITSTNWLYWTNQGQNWNGMCAECHSTNLNKNYNLKNDSFNTTWVDIDVNCESCHGPGSEHLKWAKLPPMARPYDDNLGLVLKTSSITSKQFVEACAPCHARRTSLDVNDHTTAEFYQNHMLQLPSPPNYFVDGQILEEVYVFGSFSQSEMYMKDVICSDCHDSHSLQFKFEDNLLCTQCHRAEEYDTYEHHFHKYKNENGQPVIDKFGVKINVGEGALCKTCHMPGRYYMGVDFRRDHSFRIPRPDLTIELGVPNACNDCHADRSADWALSYITKYYGEKRKQHYATVFADANELKAGADTSLIKIIENDLYPEIIRATAIQYLSNYSSERSYNKIKKALNDIEPVVRVEAINAFSANDAQDFVSSLFPILNDPVKVVRIQAANKLSVLRREEFTEEQFKTLSSVLKEYLETLKYSADFPAGRYNLGNFYSSKDDYVNSELNYKKAIEFDSLFYPAKSNLAMLYYNNGKLKEAENLFKDLIENHPEYNEGNYFLGLLYAEQKRFEESAEQLENAAKNTANNIRIYYNLGLIYQQLNQDLKAEKTLLAGYNIFPNNFDILYALVDFYAKRGNKNKALKYANELNQKFPSNPTGQQLIDYIKKQM